MSDVPCFSTIITTRNRASILPAAIDSVLAQDLPSHEIIVVDDGSTDDTPQVVASYPRVRYVPTKQGSCAGSRNVGIQHATGDWIAFLDDDDVWLPHKLRCCAEVLASDPAVRLVFSAARMCDYDLRPDDSPSGYWRGPDLAGHVNAYDAFLDDLPSPSTVVMRRDVFDQVGLFDTTVPRAEDRDMWFRVTGQGVVCAAILECLILYRLHDLENGEVVHHCFRDGMTVLRRYFAPGQPMVPSRKRQQQVRWKMRGWYAGRLLQVARQEAQAGHEDRARRYRRLAAQISLPHYLKMSLGSR